MQPLACVDGSISHSSTPSLVVSLTRLSLLLVASRLTRCLSHTLSRCLSHSLSLYHTRYLSHSLSLSLVISLSHSSRCLLSLSHSFISHTRSLSPTLIVFLFFPHTHSPTLTRAPLQSSNVLTRDRQNQPTVVQGASCFLARHLGRVAVGPPMSDAHMSHVGGYQRTYTYMYVQVTR